MTCSCKKPCQPLKCPCKEGCLENCKCTVCNNFPTCNCKRLPCEDGRCPCRRLGRVCMKSCTCPTNCENAPKRKKRKPLKKQKVDSDQEEDSESEEPDS